jgi:hypothetical protein
VTARAKYKVMQLNDQVASEDTVVRERRGRHSLFYFEQVGSRSYLRITRLGIILVLLFTVLPLIDILSLFLVNRSTPPPDVDVIIKPRPVDNNSMHPAIKQPSPPPTPKAVRQPTSKQPSPPALATPPNKGNTP